MIGVIIGAKMVVVVDINLVLQMLIPRAEISMVLKSRNVKLKDGHGMIGMIINPSNLVMQKNQLELTVKSLYTLSFAIAVFHSQNAKKDPL